MFKVEDAWCLDNVLSLVLIWHFWGTGRLGRERTCPLAHFFLFARFWFILIRCLYSLQWKDWLPCVCLIDCNITYHWAEQKVFPWHRNENRKTWIFISTPCFMVWSLGRRPAPCFLLVFFPTWEQLLCRWLALSRTATKPQTISGMGREGWLVACLGNALC